MFRDMSIRKKLTVLLMGSGAAAVILASIVFYVMTTSNFRKSYENDLASLSRIFAHNCEASLAFRIPEEAERVLTSLSERPSVVYTVILDQEDNIFAAYENNPGRAVRNVMTSDNRSQRQIPGHLKISQDIIVGGNRVGSIVLFDDMRGIKKARLVVGSMMFFAVLISMCAALAMVSLMQGLISKPIMALSAAAGRISREKDFSLRTEKHGNDEVGQLVDNFNEMIEQIEKRNTELIASEKRFRTLVDQAVDAFFLFDTDGTIVDVNQRACDSLGYSRAELVGMTIRDIESGGNSGNPDINPWPNLQPLVPVTIESINQRKDGTTFPVEMRLGLLEIGGYHIIMCLVRDISERKMSEAEKTKLEFQLQQAQKMEAIGVLAGGIAHDFNNILTGIIGYAELAKTKLPPESPVLKDLNQVLKGGTRATDLVKQILTFSRQANREIMPVEVSPIIKEAIKLLRASIPTSIEINQNIDPHSGSVLANPTQIHQILMNLCTNAYYAMRETGGILGIFLEEVEITNEDVNPLLAPSPGRYIRLMVSDTGHGMDKATMERIFEPYFTTKPPGEGTGMGLSVVHGIVKSYNGHISVYSEPGQGTIFHVYLPKIETAAIHSTIMKEPVKGGSEHVLIVDDEEMIVSLEKEMLTRLGYKITACSTPAQALETFRSTPEIFDLVITDMTMPKMLGTELAKEMLSIRPGISIILCTGFSDMANENTVKALGIKEYVMKPIVFAEFAGTIRKVLDSKT